MTAGEQYEVGTETTTPAAAARHREEFAEALAAWASSGYRAGHAVEAPRARGLLDQRFPGGGLSLPAAKLADLLLASAYAAGSHTVRAAVPDLAAFLRVGGSRPPQPAEVVKYLREIADTVVVWGAEGTDPMLKAGVECPTVERVGYDGERWVSYAVPDALCAATIQPSSFVRLDLGAVRACRRRHGPRLVHLGALYGQAADDFRRHIVREYDAGLLAEMVGYKRRGRVSPARLLAEVLKPAMDDVPLGNWYRVGFVRADIGGDYDLDGNYCKEDPRKILMYVFSANPRPAPDPDLYDGPGYARESAEGRRRLEQAAFRDALLSHVVAAEAAGTLDAATAADERRWVAEASAEAQAEIAEAERRYREHVDAEAAQVDAALLAAADQDSD